MKESEVVRRLYNTERIEYLPAVRAGVFKNFARQTNLLSSKEAAQVQAIDGATYLGTIYDSERRRVKVWEIPFEGHPFYLLTHKGRGTSYETENPDGLQCVRFLLYLQFKFAGGVV